MGTSAKVDFFFISSRIFYAKTLYIKSFELILKKLNLQT